MNARAIGFALVAALVPASAMAECQPGDFFDKNDYKEDTRVELSLAWNLSESEFNKRKTSAGVTVPIYGVPVTASYSDYKESIKRKAEALKLDRFEQRALSHATSSLTANGLEAYKTCLNSERGDFRLLLRKGQSQESYDLNIIYSPALIAGNAKWRVVFTNNLEGESDTVLKNELNNAPDASVALDKGFTLRPIDRKQEALVQIGLGAAVTRAIILPPLHRDLPLPRWPECLEYSSIGECLKCRVEIQADAITAIPAAPTVSDKDSTFVICRDMVQSKLLVKTKGTVCVNQGQGSNISLYLIGPDGRQYGKSANAAYYFTSGGAGNCALFEMSSSSELVSNSKNAKAGIGFRMCHNNVANGVAACRLEKSLLQICAVDTACQW